MADSSIKWVRVGNVIACVILLQLWSLHKIVIAPEWRVTSPVLIALGFPTPLPLTFLTALFPLSRHLPQRWDYAAYGHWCVCVGGMTEVYHHGSNSGETTWQKAALEVSNGGHPSPSSCLITIAHILYSLHNDLIAQAFPCTQVKDIFQDDGGNEAVKDTEERAPLGVTILSISSYSNDQYWQVTFNFGCSMVVSKGNFSHWQTT